MNILLFDGFCNLCHGMASFVRKRDKNALFRFVAIQSEAGQTLIKQYSINNSNDTFYYICGSVYFEKSAAVLHLLKDLGGMWKCFYPLILMVHPVNA